MLCLANSPNAFSIRIEVLDKSEKGGTMQTAFEYT